VYAGSSKKFKDTIHGYIDIPNVIVSNIIDTEQFQRLKYIEQTSMRSLYPAARHDRFIHSLGVYWLGRQAFECLRKNAQNILSEEEKKKLSEVWWDRQEILFSLACLLHDCAHAPFSHTLENMYILRKNKILPNDLLGLCNGMIIAELDYRLLEECKSDEEFINDFLEKSISGYNGVGAPHEKMSSYCVIANYKEAIKAICKEFVEGDILDEEIVFIVRMIIGCTYKSEGFKKSIKNCIISMLNSSAIDVDGLDYIVRDSYMSGIDNFNIDYQRLLSSLVLIPVEVFDGEEKKPINLDGMWLKGTELTIKEFKADAISGKLTIDGVGKYDKENINGIDCKLIEKDSTYTTKVEDTIRIKRIKSGTILFDETCKLHKTEFTGSIRHGRRIQLASNVEFSSNNKERAYILGYDKKALSIIEGTIEARNHEYLWVYTHPKVLYNSNYLQCELLRDVAKYLCCNVNNTQFDREKLSFNCKECKYNKDDKSEKKYGEDDILLYIIGYDTYFKEDSQGDNGVDVRCQDSLRKELCEAMSKKGFVFNRTCDDDLIALFKRIYIENARRQDMKSDKLDSDFKEFFSRRHKKPLWKSFVEYDNFLKICEEDTELNNTIPRFCDEVVRKADTRDNNYVILTCEQQEVFEKYGLTDVVIVKSSVKTKELNPNETFIKFQDQILRLYDIFAKESRKEKISKEFYYIFANMDRKLKRKELVDMVKELEAVY
jgi:HD superfamily phosphohydrolase